MSNGIKPLSGNNTVDKVGEASPETTPEVSVSPPVQQQRGAGVGSIEFPDDHHQTFYPLEAVFKKDPQLGLALSREDDKIGYNDSNRRQGYLEDEELEEARAAVDERVMANYDDIVRFTRGENWNPRNLDELAERFPEIAAELAEVDRAFSIRKGHSDSYKVDQLPVELQARYVAVDQALRAEAQVASVDSEAQSLSGKAVRVRDDIASDDRSVGDWVGGVSIGTGIAAGVTGAILFAGGPVMWACIGAAALSGIVPIAAGHNRRSDWTQGLGKGFRKLTFSKTRRKELAERKDYEAQAAEKSRRAEELKALALPDPRSRDLGVA